MTYCNRDHIRLSYLGAYEFRKCFLIIDLEYLVGKLPGVRANEQG